MKYMNGARLFPPLHDCDRPPGKHNPSATDRLAAGLNPEVVSKEKEIPAAGSRHRRD